MPPTRGGSALGLRARDQGRAGQAGRMVVMEAVELQARAIVMTLPPRSGTGGSLLGKTLETVLADRPCRVLIQSEPDPKFCGKESVSQWSRHLFRR